MYLGLFSTSKSNLRPGPVLPWGTGAQCHQITLPPSQCLPSHRDPREAFWTIKVFPKYYLKAFQRPNKDFRMILNVAGLQVLRNGSRGQVKVVCQVEAAVQQVVPSPQGTLDFAPLPSFRPATYLNSDKVVPCSIGFHNTSHSIGLWLHQQHKCQKMGPQYSSPHNPQNTWCLFHSIEIRS